MKNLCRCIIIIISIWVIQSCNQKGKNTAIANADSISSADSLNALKDTSPKANVPADSADIRFIIEAVKGCIAESGLAKLALHHAKNKRIKNFGAIMIKDITKANNKLAAIAKSRHITLPAAPGISQQKEIDELSKKSGKDFDKDYVNAMITDHTNYLEIFKNASKNSTDPEIKAFVNKALRVLNNHLEAINTIHDSMK